MENASAVSACQRSEVDPIDPAHLLQMVWYTTKAPRSQYQAWKRATERFKQAKRDLNGVNAVRR